MSKLVYAFLIDGFEEVEAFTPIDFLRRCEGVEVVTVGVRGLEVTGSHKISTKADITLDQVDMEKADMIIIPGGMPGTVNLAQTPAFIELVHKAFERDIIVGAICAAPSILGKLGYLKGKNATCATGFEQQLYASKCTGEPVEVDGNVITARGAGVSCQFAFALIEKLVGEKVVKDLKGAVKWA